jgi:hypothetical protein
LEGLERCLDKVELTITIIEIVAVLAFISHLLLFLLIKVGDLKF